MTLACKIAGCKLSPKIEIHTKFNRLQCCLCGPNIFGEVFVSKNFQMYTTLDETKGAFCLSEQQLVG